jgi:hypothetical protein
VSARTREAAVAYLLDELDQAPALGGLEPPQVIAGDQRQLGERDQLHDRNPAHAGDLVDRPGREELERVVLHASPVLPRTRPCQGHRRREPATRGDGVPASSCSAKVMLMRLV